MTIGISKERLDELKNRINDRFENGSPTQNIYGLVLDQLISECTELKQWKQIDENTPKHRTLLMWHEPSEQPIIAYFNYPNCTYWQELPGPPK